MAQNTKHTPIFIQPKKTITVWDNCKDIVSNWEIAWSLALHDIQIRYKQSVVGIFWTLFQPLLRHLSLR